ncbi:Kinesin-like protein KIF20A [Triplophysa tibetana]|uniref:Kinesin-like protein KIF20A n=1 Tax=Triplophysa tibetana TaxID=1572043 RepID=A0A5A9PNX1_9TELE|nr:Kinesin-like protein KIF20A [Triplophysa tibetana]
METVVDVTNEDTMLLAMQSTACEPHHAPLPELSGVSSITSQSESAEGSEQQQQLRVYLKVRPFSEDELKSNEDQGCVVLENSEVIALHAPKGSATMKNSEKGIGQQVYKFNFTQIFGPSCSQSEFFEGTISSQVQGFLHGKNALVFSYGVTNAGKTYTIQGNLSDFIQPCSQKEPGILTRALEVLFKHIAGRQYETMDLKPYLSLDVQKLDMEQLKAEKNAKAALFALLKEEPESTKASRSRSSTSSSVNSLSFSGVSYDHTVDSVDGASDEGSCLYSVWVAFYEIYNEHVYDLLQPPHTSKTKRRPALRVCEDSTGSSYVRDLRWVNVQNVEEASKVLRVGNKNRSAAATKMNQSSSRSHTIFTIKLIRIDGADVHGLSDLSLCDLAGSERCNKTKTFGERLKEAGNINNSLLILGKCIAALRNIQNDRTKTNYIPFRESKLTRLFQGMFCGRGRASMIVNINQCASTYDETLHVMKFSAVAKQVLQVIPQRSVESLAPRLVGRDGKPLLKNGVIDAQAVDEYLSEEELLDSDDEADMSIFPQEELVSLVESLRLKLLAERRKNLLQEIQIRNEMGDVMMQQIMEAEELHSRQMVDLKEGYEEKMESTFDMYKEALKEHAYQCALERLEEDYIPIEEYNEELERVKARKRLNISSTRICGNDFKELENLVSELEQKWQRSASVPPVTQESSMQTDPLPATPDVGMSAFNPYITCIFLRKVMRIEMISLVCFIHPLNKAAERFQLLYKEKCAVEKLCVEKQELVVSFEQRIGELNETLQEAGESYMEKLADVQNLQNKLSTQEREIVRLQSDVTNKEAELNSLREELSKLNDSAGQSRTRRGLLVNIKESMTPQSPGSLCRTIKKSVRATTSLRKKPS